MPDMQKEIHPELEQSDKGGVSEMPENQEEGKASPEQEAEKLAREISKSGREIMEIITGIQQDALLLSLHPTIPGGFPWESLRDDRPHNSLETIGTRGERTASAIESAISVPAVSLTKEESREPSDAGQADRSNPGTGKDGNVDPEGSEGV